MCFANQLDALSRQKPPQYVCTAEGWINNGDTCYHVLDRMEKWHQVQATCDALKAKFAYVDDQSDMDAVAIAAALRSAPTVWLMGTNADHQKAGKFIWKDAARTEVDGSATRWAPGFPRANAPLDQFIFMKVDLEKRRSHGLAHSVGSIHRYVACMLPAKDLVEAENQRVVKMMEDPFLHSTTKRPSRLHKRTARRRRRKLNRLALVVFDRESPRTKKSR
ncbi:hypothetical protein BV898_07306 [Hypsibius exemplaris]|uniref:C-type lectin domain-containing protein n=1 Tax=Hypsibius exemplaris TaxID=2072580 RepID=A0A1W0WU00_HYPEX|nr:hypothetical protein BV898_07306 [Hypsibius exemplaris]